MKKQWLFLLLFAPIFVRAQSFTILADSSNPIVSTPSCGIENNTNNNCFQGAAWVDVNGDNWLDLFFAGKLFLNDQSGSFTQSAGVDLTGIATRNSSCSWMDYDNDNDPDLLFFNEGIYGTKVLDNDGTGLLTAHPTILDSVNSTCWSAQWCDYNLDRRGDVIITFADGFAGNVHFPNRLYMGGNGGQLLVPVNDTFEFLTDLHPYTVSYWIDYDEDGDQDLFIAAGPAGSLAPDFLYKNMVKETGIATFEKITNLSFSAQNQNGQCYNFIDYDNDGDLDMCLTNWNLTTNRFYRNDNGTFTSIVTPFTTNSNGYYLTNAWGDLDNDGDLDVLFTSNNQTTAVFYLNNGNGTFSYGAPIGQIVGGFTSGMSLGDYDNDGDLDFFVTGNVKGLFRNDLSGSLHFLNLNLQGVLSNSSAIGSRIRVKATINGQSVWQKREVSTQNTFMGHNSQRLHFGLGDAMVADSVIIDWPSGHRDIFANVATDNFYQVIEQGALQVLTLGAEKLPQKQPANAAMRVFPNPNKKQFSIQFSEIPDRNIEVDIYNGKGALVFKNTYLPQNSLDIQIPTFSAGYYVLSVKSGKVRLTQPIVVE